MRARPDTSWPHENDWRYLGKCGFCGYIHRGVSIGYCEVEIASHGPKLPDPVIVTVIPADSSRPFMANEVAANEYVLTFGGAIHRDNGEAGRACLLLAMGSSDQKERVVA